ncbi:MAG: thioesterase family protein [Thiotrichales bacterium]|nr:MAG: thioesterase family protein [Thiotrichales bacterium]
MRLRLRLLFLMISSFWKKPLGALDESVLDLRVLLNDIDVSKITNDRFIALMDLGRMDIAFRTGLLKTMYRNKWVPLATFDTIRFRYPLKLFQKYRLRTRIVWWDESTFYFRQIFERNGRVLATGYVCATLLGEDGPIDPGRILAVVDPSVTKPDRPEIVARLREIEDLIHATQADQS